LLPPVAAIIELKTLLVENGKNKKRHAPRALAYEFVSASGSWLPGSP